MTLPSQQTSDITYLDTGEGWMYLTVILDLYSSIVVDFALAEHSRSSLVIDALSAYLTSLH